MLPSLHDDYLVSYQVSCEARQIKLRARHPAWKKMDSDVAIIFDGVEGYDFRDDAFGNIIFSLDEVPVERVLAEFGAQIAESHRLAGAPGPWAADLTSAAHVLGSKGVRGFILSSTMGLSGWVLAKDASITSIRAGRHEGETTMRYAVVIEKAAGNYCAYVPDLELCVATGATVAAVKEEIRAAIRFHIEGLQADGLEVPQPSSIAEYVEA